MATDTVAKSHVAPSTSESENDGCNMTAVAALACLATSKTSSVQAHPQNVSEEDDESDEFSIPQKFTKSGRKRAIPFPLKLLKLLSCKDNADVIDWMPSGKSFLIKKPKVFTSEILPTFFKNAKYSSFTRKLHRWGFMRHYRGLEAGAFFHPDFQKDRLDLVEKMTCYKLEAALSTSNVNESLSTVPVLTRDQLSLETSADEKPSVRALLDSSVSPQQADAFPVVNCSVQNKTEIISSEYQKRVNQYSNAAVALKQNLEPSIGFEPSVRFPASLSVGTTFTSPGNSISEKLNAAIEAEVSRRLNERINAAALTSQAIALMQSKQLWQSNPAVTGRVLGWNQEQIRNPSALLNGQNSCIDPRTALSIAGSRGLFKHPALSLSSLGGIPTLRTLPRTNIEGAKTA